MTIAGQSVVRPRKLSFDDLPDGFVDHARRPRLDALANARAVTSRWGRGTVVANATLLNVTTTATLLSKPGGRLPNALRRESNNHAYIIDLDNLHARR